MIGGTIFQHKEIHKLTWKSPDSRTVNQIDHVVINSKWRRSLKDVHTCRGADAGSDHYLVVSRLKLCLRKAPIKHYRQRRYNIARLKHEDTQKAFVLEVKNQFQKLSTDELDRPTIGTYRISERQRMHGPNFLAPQHHRTKHRMERTTMHWLHRLQESF